MKDKDGIEIYAELWEQDESSYENTQKITVRKDDGEITVNNRRVTIKSYDKPSNVLKLQEYSSDGCWLLNEKTSGRDPDPGKIYEQLMA